MAQKRKIRCDCGGYLEERIASFDNFETEAMVCSKCKFTTLTREQAQKYVRLRQMHQLMDAERKIIKVGNSMGLTLPEGLQEFGAKVGKRVRIEALGPKSFKVELVS
ncbi:MAG: hypothetical protein ABIF10_01085 [Candidatus Woesearchaeota archaeon]